MDIVYNFVTILFIVVIIRSFIISPFHVSGNSMLSTLHDNDYIIVDKLSYFFREPKANDIVIFKPPNPRLRMASGVHCLIAKASNFSLNQKHCNLPDFFIKRIIGVQGDIIEIKNGKVYKNDELLEENYLNEENKNKTFIPEDVQEKKYEVPANSYFVMGDNRNGSSDSRAHSQEWTNEYTKEYDPFVKEDDIKGRYFFTLFSTYNLRKFFNGLQE